MITDSFAVYIVTNKRNTVLYTGSTNNLKRRITEHKKLYRGFTAKYQTTKLVYCEYTNSLKKARLREKQIKNLVRRKKITLIERVNPE